MKEESILGHTEHHAEITIPYFFLFADNLPESLFDPFDIISNQNETPYETPKQAHNPVPDSLFRETTCS